MLSKLATTNLTMTAQEYKNLRERETLESTIAFLQNRAADHNIPIYDITSLRDSVHHDNMMATRKHKEWKPPQVSYLCLGSIILIAPLKSEKKTFRISCQNSNVFFCTEHWHCDRATANPGSLSEISVTQRPGAGCSKPG